MSTAEVNGISINYKLEGEGDETIVLVNGLADDLESWGYQTPALVDAGFRVLSFDNRGIGQSDAPAGPYTTGLFAADTKALVDSLGITGFHMIGVSMGGMIAQRLAIDHRDRLLSLTSVMSRTGEPEYGQSSPEAMAVLTAKPARSRDEYVENQIAATRVYGSKPEWIDEPYLRTRAARAFDRCYCPAGVGRQMQAIMRDGDRADELRTLTVPTLVMHGDRDKLIDPSGGRRTAELIPGARYVEIEGMGHDYPRAVWDRLVETWADFVRFIS
jgi:pimeloyl-ACP methyl ester carboxylesterase